MDKLIGAVIETIETKLRAVNEERIRDEQSRLAQAHLRVLGQFSLMANPQVSSQLPLAATMDFVALIEGDWCIRSIVKQALAKHGLAYDELSTEIWMPPETTYLLLHESSLLRVELSDPVSTLVSKAMKAPEKNALLVREALSIFGAELASAIRRFGGNLEPFGWADDEQ